MNRPDSPPDGVQGRAPNAWWLALTLALVTFFVYLPVRHHEFVSYDDAEYVTDNARVQAGLTWAGVKWAFTTGHASNWHPLTWLSHMLDVQLFGPGPAGPHLVNLLFHLANTVLLFVVLRRYTGSRWRSAFVAALFALHPLRVESVAWVAERKDVLSAFFFLLTLRAYASYATPARGEIKRRPLWYAATLLLFTAGLLSKPMVVTLPCVLLLLDVWPLRRIDLAAFHASWRNSLPLLREKIPFFFLSALLCAITIVVQERGGSVRSLISYSLAERGANALVAYASYLGKTIWPTDLAVFYPHPGEWPIGGVGLAGLFLIGISAGCLKYIRQAPFPAICWFWFLGMLVPTVGLVQVGDQFAADRYTYLPSIGVFVLLVWGAGAAVVRWQLPRAPVVLAATAILTTLAWLTRGQLQHWKDSEHLFARALAVTEKNFVAHNGLGYTALQKGSWDEAIGQFQRAIEFHPRFVEAHTNLGNAYLQKGQTHSAIAAFEQALKIQPNFALARYNLGTLLLENGQVDAALAQLQQAVDLRPDDAVASVNLGNALLQKGRLEEAGARYEKALAIDRNYADAHNNLGHVFLQSGRVPDALSQFEKAVELQPNHANAHYNLADAYLRVGRREEGIAHLQKTVELQPSDAEAHAVLGTAYADGGQFAEALTATRRALDLARAQGNSGLVTTLSAQFSRYEAGAPFREQPPAEGRP